MISFRVGHIGVFVSSKSQKEVAPAIAKWLKDRSEPEKKEAVKKTSKNKDVKQCLTE